MWLQEQQRPKNPGLGVSLTSTLSDPPLGFAHSVSVTLNSAGSGPWFPGRARFHDGTQSESAIRSLSPRAGNRQTKQEGTVEDDREEIQACCFSGAIQSLMILW